MAARYAIYFAPEPNTALWTLGCRWLGRDAERDRRIAQPELSGWTHQALRALTAVPRRYGWHATLKPPFALRQECSAQSLYQRLDAFCARRAAFALPQLAVARLSAFVALRPAAESDALQALADDCVVQFDDLRAALTPSQTARRRAGSLDAREQALLVRYGYPYVLDRFRFHLTLTQTVDQAATDRLLPALSAYFAPALRESVSVCGVSLFLQPAPKAHFRLVRRFPFGG